MAKDDGGQAFPLFRHDNGANDTIPGISARDYFAAAALQGLLSDPKIDAAAGVIATKCYEVADAMLKARGE